MPLTSENIRPYRFTSDDIELFRLLGDQAVTDIVRQLVIDGPMRQVELAERLGLTAATVSRTLKKLEEARLVTRSSHHGPYELAYPEKLTLLVTAAGDLVDQVLRDRAEEAKVRVDELRRAQMRRPPRAARQQAG